MSRRSQSSEVGFESDSFLDIIANIVGILIILIVIAGVRVSQEPVPVSLMIAKQESKPNTVTEPPVQTHLLTQLQSQYTEMTAAIGQQHIVQKNATELQRQSQAVALGNRKLQEEISRRQKPLQSEIEQQQNLAIRLADTSAEVKKLKGALISEQQLQQQLNEQLEIGRDIIVEQLKLEKQLKQPPVQKWKHRLTPVSRQTKGDEIHFYLRDHRLTQVPIKALLSRAEKRLMQQRSWLLKYNKVQFSVGPIEGFTLKFQAERKMASLVNQLRSVRPSAVVQMAFQIAPSESLQSESIEQAMSPRGRFYQALLTADPHTTTLSIWVYPESYAGFRKLKAFAAEQNFAVAAWPREQGEPITGGSGGVNSAAQ